MSFAAESSPAREGEDDRSEAFRIADRKATEIDPEGPNLLKVKEVRELFCKHLSIGETTWHKRCRPLISFVQADGRSKVTTVRHALLVLEVMMENRVGKLGPSRPADMLKEEIQERGLIFFPPDKEDLSGDEEKSQE